MSVLFRVYFIHLRRKVQRQDIQAALCYRQPERCVNTGSGDRQCLRRPTFGAEGQRADLLTVQCDLHPSAASRGHTQCGIVLNTCSFFTHIMLAIHLPMQLLLRSHNSPRMLLYNHTTTDTLRQALEAVQTKEGGRESLTALSPSIFAKLSYFCRTIGLA